MTSTDIRSGADADSEAPSSRVTATPLAAVAWLPIPAFLLVWAQYRRGSDSVLRLHDVFDIYVPVLSRLTLSDLFAAPGHNLPYVLGGLERDFVGGEFHLLNVLLVILPPLWGLLIAELILRTLAFVGMRLFLRRLGGEVTELSAWVASTLFSLLPFYVPALGAIAGVPLLFWAFLRIYDDRQATALPICVLMLFPLVGSFPFTAPYLLLFAGAVGACWFLLDRTAVRPLLQGLAVLLVSLIVADWRLVKSMVVGPTTQRVDMVVDRQWGSFMWEGLPQYAVEEPTFSHSPSGRSTLLGFVLLFGLIGFLVRYRWLDSRTRRAWLLLISALGVLVVVSRVWPAVESDLVAALLTDWGRFQLERVNWVEPAVVYACVGLSLGRLHTLLGRRWRRAGVLALVVIGLVQASTLVDRHPFRSDPDMLTVGQFLAESSFDQIKSVVDNDGGERVVSIGIHPAASIFSGLSAADGYWNVYDLDYKREFRPLIAPALAQDESLRRYYDDWGNRVYLFQPSVGIPRCCTQPDHGDVQALIGADSFDDLGITHVVSTGNIVNAPEVRLELAAEIDEQGELGRLYVYRVVAPGRG